MSKKRKEHSRWVNGISDFLKEGPEDSYYIGRSIDHRSDPRSIKLLPKTIKESGSIIEGLPMWGEIVGTDLYVYDRSGNLYKRTSAGVWTKIRTVASSHGNGLSYFGEDDFIYYSTDTGIGRYGPISNNPSFVDDYFGSQGGVPLNTNSLYLVSASSQYGYRADTATLSIAGDIALEAQIKPTILPSTGEEKTIVSKWNQSGNIRSYKFDITTESNFFGDGSDGALTISSDTTEAPIDSACTGTTGTQTLSATNASFAATQKVLIHQSRGTGAGTYQINKIISYTAGTITLDLPLNATYTSGAQVRVLKQYTNVTVNSGKTYTAKAWDGTVGGILAFLANGTVTVTGTITATGKGYRGGTGSYTNDGRNPTSATSGEGYSAAGYATVGFPPNTDWSQINQNGTGIANTIGGGAGFADGNSQTGAYGGGGAGGGHATSGSNGTRYNNYSYYGAGGGTGGTTDLSSFIFGGGGGGGAASAQPTGSAGNGGNGGGAVLLFGANVTISGSVVSNGSSGTTGGTPGTFPGGSGAGGSILIKTQVGTLGSSLITCTGAGTVTGTHCNGGAAGNGRIHIDYLTSYTGTTSPTITYTQDTTLGTVDGYVLRLKTSSNGTLEDTYTKKFTPVLNVWQHVAVSWDASASTAEFFHNGASLGTSVGSGTSISDNASEFFVGAYKNGAGTATGFFDGYLDEVRVWNRTMTGDDFALGTIQQILTTTPYLNAYYKFNGDVQDATANANHLTASGSPTYPADVPFPSPTTRLDIDQSATTTGNTYTTPVAITETSTHRKTFVPAKDPQKSIAVLVAAKGTGNWTITVHDAFNNTITSATIANANVAVGYNEFVFTTPWRPLLNQNYHFHVTSTVNDGTVTTTNASDLETVSFRTYYQFLVTDTEWHPIAKMLQFIVFGNERYVAKYEATTYEPNKITLPSGYRVRCFGYWREYLAIGTMRGSTITEQDAGRVYFWDGIASTYNFFIDVPEGGINALLGSKGKLYVWAGYQGDLLVYQGGDSADQIKRLPALESDEYIEIYPGAVSMWKMLPRWGTATTDSATVQTGVYTWGSQNVRYNESLSFDYVVSTGRYDSNIKIGMVKVVNKKLLIGYQDNVSYGVDYVDASNDSYATGEIQQVLEDDGAVWKEKEALIILATFEPLNSGESVDIKYKIDREDNWHRLGAVTTANATFARMVVWTDGSRYHEIQYGAELATTTTTSPKLLGLTIERDFLETESRV